ncbi:hypothetical protein JKF63_07412 [Porcisia hertigi]|uniref:C2HC/C3H-type domain-containing protein n=1 Tax=Porcisia hertigi TaxID=2761500 RepID=A0A836LKV3_9TRYP|nr:hypothetical protein JKF63_07412 [Porcisia hertigi]
MPAGVNSRTPATDFVQDYAAKRQAQMERARQLREDRIQQQQKLHPPPSIPNGAGGDGGSAYNASPTYPTATSANGGDTTATAWRQPPPPPPPPNVARSHRTTAGHDTADNSASSGKRGDGDVLYVKEQNFKEATQAGIITPDQARQLWAMLSNQIIRVCSPSAHANTVSVNSLLALSSNSHNSSSRTGGGPQPASSSEFGASISLESLRTSIAYFKKEQQRLQQQGGGTVDTITTGAPSQGRHVPPSPSPALSTTAGPPSSQLRGIPQRQLQYEENTTQDRYYPEDDGTNKDEPWAPVASQPPLRGGGGRGGGGRSTRPAWNPDVEVRHEEEDHHSHHHHDDDRSRRTQPTSTAGSGPAALKKPRTGKTNVVRSGVNVAAAPSTSTIGFGGTSFRTGNDDEESASNMYTAQQPSAAVSRASKTGGAGVGGRRPPATRATALPHSSGAPLNLDDLPVGSGSGGGGGMSDWGNAYPPGVKPPAITGDNDAIAAEAAAAAQEPMQECRTCGRRFRISVLVRHEGLCRKQANKPRKIFNMREQRLDGVDGIKEVQRAVARTGGGGGGNRSGGFGRGGGVDTAAAAAAKGKLPKWKVQHEQFQAAMRAVRQQQQGGAGGGGFGSGPMAPPPAPIPEEYDDRVPCPHCGRKFAQDVAARHIPKCATTIAKPKGIRPIRR